MRILSLLLVIVALASACEGTDILDHTIDAALRESDGPSPGADAPVGPLADGPPMGPPADGPSMTISVAALGTETPVFVDAAWEPSTRCGVNGVYLAASGSALAGCTRPLSSQIAKPSLQVQLSDRSAGTYDVVGDDCPGSGPRFFATFDEEGGSTGDASGGGVTIESLEGDVLSGSFTVTFPQGVLLGYFAAPRCGG